MSRTVLFVGGPWHGMTETVDDGARTVCALEPPETSLADFSGLPDPFGPVLRQVAYSLFRFALCGRIIWIGYPGVKPDDDLVFEVLTSDAAKAASNVYYEPGAHP